MCQIVFTARALPRTPLGSSQRSLGPLAGFTRERREKRGREGNDRKGGKGKGVKEQKEGEMRKEREGTSVLSQLIMGCASHEYGLMRVFKFSRGNFPEGNISRSVMDSAAILTRWYRSTCLLCTRPG